MNLLHEIRNADADGSDTAGVAPVWPWTWRGIAAMAAAFVALTTAFTTAGFVVVEWFTPTRLGRAEETLAKDLEDARTSTWNTIADIASIPSDTPVKIGLVVVLAVALPALWKRWHDWTFLASALLLEVSVYGLSSYLVGRPRPPVERLSSAPTESFPSGHVAAAVTFYFGLALIIGWHVRTPWAQRIALAVASIITVGMVASRLYLGMHYVSDVIAGLILGALALVITRRLIGWSLAEKRAETPEPWPRRARRHDLTP